MKKFLLVLVLMFTVFSLVGCKEKVLENPEKNYYATGQFAGWGDAAGNATYAMAPIKLSDERVASIKDKLKSATYLYVLEITLPTGDAGWTATYTIDSVEKVFNGNLTVKVIRTAKSDETNEPEFWAQNPESGKIDNLTPTTLYIPPFVEENVGGAGSWNDNSVAFEAGTYYLVFAEFVSQKGVTRAMGLIKKV